MAEVVSELHAGIDAGTTGATVAFFNTDGVPVASGYQEYSCLFPHPGWVEQDMEAVWRGICSACRAAVAAAGGAAAAIRSLAFASQRGTFVLLDAHERPLAPAIVWNDSRAKAMEEAIARSLDAGRYRAITGVPLAAAWAAAKIAWLNHHRPDLMRQTRWICNGQEYFLRRLGAGGYTTDPASLTLNGMMDIRRLDWSDEVLAAIGIGRAILPPIGRPGTVVGAISPQAAEATGLPAGVPIAIGAGDQQCAAVGAGVIEPGRAEITIGTAAMMVAHLDHPDLVRGPAPYLGGHAVGGKWDAEGGAFASGSCLRWWRDQLGQAEVEAAGRLRLSPYDLMVAQAANAPPGSRGVLFHPFLAGQVTPYYDATARGGFFGLGLDHDRACLIRSVLEGCACELRLMVESFDRDLEGGIQDLRLNGGGTRSRDYVQIQADVLRRPVTLLATEECTVLGAAILGAVAIGAFPDLTAAVRAMVHVRTAIEPRQENGDLYDALFALYKDIYESVAEAGIYQRIYRFQNAAF
jgi:xylulokinase